MIRVARESSCILLVDDVPDNLLALEGMLRRDGVEILTARSGREALEILLAREIAVAIVDVQMPDVDGFELAELMRGAERTRHVPVIFVTAGSRQPYRMTAGYQAGAIDFLYKPLDPSVLQGKVEVLLQLDRQRRQLQSALAETHLLFRLAETTAHCRTLDDVYGAALDGVRELLGAERSAILLFDDDGVMRFKAWRGLSEFYRAAVEGHSPWNRDARDPEPVVVCDAEQDPAVTALRPVLSHEGIRALAFIPIVHQRRLLGKFMLYWDRTRSFSEHERELAATVAAHVAQSLDRARLAEAAERTKARDAFLSEAGLELSKSLDPGITLRKIAELAVPRLADWCAVELDGRRIAVAHADPEKVALADRLYRQYPPDPAAPRGVPQVLRTGRSELYPDIPDEMLAKSAQNEDHLRILRGLGLRSGMVVPIPAGPKTVGAITFVTAESGRRYGSSDLDLAEELGRRAGMATENARLYAAEKRAREDLASVLLISDAALGGLDLDALLDEMLSRVRSIFRCDTATVLLLAADGSRVEVRASQGIEREAWARVAVPYGVAIAGGIAARREPMVVDDLSTVEVYSPVLRERLRSLAGVPLLLKDRILGVLHIGSVRPRKFTPEDVGLLELVASRVATAVDRATAYEDLRRAEDRLHVALEAGGMGVWEWSVASGRVTWSPMLERIHGLAPGTFEGTFEAYQRDMHPEDKERTLAVIRDTLEHGRDHHILYRIIRPDGQVRWVAGQGKVIVGADGRAAGMLGICMDVTRQKELELAREASIAELEKNAKFHEMFTGILGHDLRNPLTAILLATRSLSSKKLGDKADNLLSRIQKSGERMDRMIHQLLDFSRIRLGRGIPVERKSTDLIPIVRQVVEELEVLHPSTRVEVHQEGDSTGVWDPDRLAQCFSNLVGNALQHGIAKHGVRVFLDGTSRDELRVEVQNQGSIDPDLLTRVFEPMAAGDRKRSRAGGLGLGFFITREILRAHGGIIEVRSEDARTTVAVRLPRTERAQG